MRRRTLALLVSGLAACVHDQPAGVQPAPQLVFTVAPHDLTVFDPVAIEVTAYDSARAAPVDYDGTITIALGQHPDSSYLFGDSSAALNKGVATAEFYLLRPGRYTIKVSSGNSLAPIESAPFTVQPAPPKLPGLGRLKFVASPTTNTTLWDPLIPPLRVAAHDDGGALVMSDSISVTVALVGANDSVLGGTRTVNTVSGVAQFNDLRITKAGSNYSFVATAPGLGADTTAKFNVAVQPPPRPLLPARRLVFGAQPRTTPAGGRILPVVQPSFGASGWEVSGVTVGARDSTGGSASYNGPVTIGLKSNPAGATLSGTLTTAGDNYTDLRINTIGSGYTLTASAPGLESATSTPFDIIAPSPTGAVRLAISSIPFSERGPSPQAGSVVGIGVVVLADNEPVSWGGPPGNVVPGFTTPVTLNLYSGPAGGMLLGTRTVIPVNGTAVFDSLVPTKGGSYVVTASASGLADASPVGFYIVPAPARFAFTGQTPTTLAGVYFFVTVQATDSGGTLASAFQGPISVQLGADAPGATLGGTLTQTARLGVAQFGLMIDKMGAGYTLVASANGIPSSTSSPFDVGGLAFIAQPNTTRMGKPMPPIRVAAVDAAGNVDTTYDGAITVRIGTGPSGQISIWGGSSTEISRYAWKGMAEFDYVTVGVVGSGYTLTASFGLGYPTDVLVATSAPFDITP